MNEYEYFMVDKSTQTFSDALVAFGLARLLDDLLRFQSLDVERDVLLTDCGAYYLIRCTPPLRAETVTQAPKFSLLPFISTASKPVPLGPNVVDYEEQKSIETTYFEARKKGISAESPHRHLPIYKAIISKDFSASSTYNKLAADWELVSGNADVLELLLNLFSLSPNKVSKFHKEWEQLEKEHHWKIGKSTQIQLFNPDRGKGRIAAKANTVADDNPKGFWLVELLKAVGFYESAMLRRVSKDRKTFVVSPQSISFEVSQTILSEFVGSIFAATSVGLDVLAVIAYTKALIKRYLDTPNEVAVEEGIWVPQRVVSGFQTAFYKSLNAVATMNVSFIALPDWIEIETTDDADAYVSLLDEIAVIARRFDRQLDSSSRRPSARSQDDVFSLLDYLRDFLSGGNLTALWKFTTSYAGYYMRMRHRGERIFPLSYSLVERIIDVMRKKYTAIGDPKQYPGFHNIARAIRNSTVAAQDQKAEGKRPLHNIRYGLNRELSNKAHDTEQFLAILGNFIHTYNAEAMRARELRTDLEPHLVLPGDLSDVLRMIDDYDGNTYMVAHLLIAFGYTLYRRRQPKPANTQQETT